jgi:hypothetical protein
MDLSIPPVFCSNDRGLAFPRGASGQREIVDARWCRDWRAKATSNCTSLYLVLQMASFWRGPVCCRWSSGSDHFFPRNRYGVKEGLPQRLPEAPAASMRPLLVVTSPLCCPRRGAARRLRNSPELLICYRGRQADEEASCGYLSRFDEHPFICLCSGQNARTISSTWPISTSCRRLGAPPISSCPRSSAGMLASGRPIVVTADDNTELSNILEGIALIVPPGDAEGLAAAILAARRKDLSAEVKRGLTLAGAMRPQRVLSLFEARFSMRGRGRSASSTPRRRPSRLSRAALIAKCEGWG